MPVVLRRTFGFGALLCLGLLTSWGCQRSLTDEATKPRTAEGWLQQGREAFLKGDFDKALKDYQQALALQPDSAVSYNLTGMAYRFQANQLGSPSLREKEIAAFRKAVELQPSFTVALVNLGSSLWEQGQKREAAKVYRSILEQAPTHPESTELTRRIAEAGINY